MNILGIFSRNLTCLRSLWLSETFFSFNKNKISSSSTELVHGGLTPFDNSLTTILQQPTSMEAALSIPQMWHSINNITDDIERNRLESRILRACIMWAALSLNKWVENTITRVQSGKANKSWVNKLLSQIENALNSKGPVGSEVILRSEDFLGQLPCQTYKWTKPRFTYNTEIIKERTRQIAHNTIREWLSFPKDKQTMVQCAFLHTLVSRTHISVLLLDIVWIAYRDPFKLVFKTSAGCHISRERIDEFKNRYYLHPFVSAQSEEYQALGRLNEEFKEVFANMRMRSAIEPQQTISSSLCFIFF